MAPKASAANKKLPERQTDLLVRSRDHLCEKWHFFSQSCLSDSPLDSPLDMSAARIQSRKQKCPQCILALFERKTW